MIAIPLLLWFTSACSSSSGANNNLENKDRYDPAAGGYYWGQNDPKTKQPQEELSSDEIIKRQEEVLKRQEIEKERLRKEREDLLRQEYYNDKLRNLQ